MAEEAEIILKGKFEDGKLIIDTTEKINKNLNEMGNEAEKSDKKSSSLFDTLKKIAAVVGIAAVVNQFKNLTKGALEAAGAMEQVDVALTTMLGSGEKAKKLTAELIAFAKKTPFQIEGIFDSTKQLLAYGFAQEDIIDTLGTLGNIAAGVGVDMNRLALAFGQVKTTGHLMGQDLNQFTQAGVPLLAALAQTLGKTEAEVAKLKESGQISFAAVKLALESLTAEGGRFYNLMENQSKTLLGTFSNMSDSFYQLKIALGDALMPVAKEVVNGMISWFTDLKKTVEDNKESILNFAKGVVTAFGYAIDAVKLAYGAVLNFIDGVKILLKIPFVKEILAFAAAVVVLTQGISGLTLAIRFLATTALGWISIAIAVATAIGYISKGMENMPDFVKIAALETLKLFELLKLGIYDFVEKVLDKLSLLSKLPMFGWIDDAKKKFQDLKNSSIDSIDKINDEIKNIKSPKLSNNPLTAPVIQDIQQKVTRSAPDGPLILPEEAKKKKKEKDPEQTRLEALRKENQALLEEQKNFLRGYGENESEADRLVLENKTLTMQQKLLQDGEYAEKKNSLDQQLLNNEITNEQFKQELQKLNDEAKLEAVQTQFDEEMVIYQENQALLNETKLAMQDEQDAIELQKLTDKAAVQEQLIAASENRLVAIKSQASTATYEKKKTDEEKSLQHTLKMDSDGYKAAQGAANELVALQNSKNKELAAIGKAAALFQITNDTARGAIAAYASLAPIPIVGPGLGAAAAAAIIAYGVERLSNVQSNSFAVGTANIPTDQMAQVHAGEMIVPASFSESIRRGDLSLSSGEKSSQSPSTNIIINFEGANFIGQLDDQAIEDIGSRLSSAISQGLIAPIPTQRS